MKLWNKSLSALICASLLAVACSGTALAATAKEKITSLKLNVESDIEVGDDTGDVTVTTEDAHYEVADVWLSMMTASGPAAPSPRLR